MFKEPFSPYAGESIDHAINRAKKELSGTTQFMSFLFNDTTVTVSAVSDISEVIGEYLQKRDRLRRENEILRAIIQA